MAFFSFPGETAFRMLHQRDFGMSEIPSGNKAHFVIRPFHEGRAICLLADINVETALEEMDIDLGALSAAPVTVEKKRYLEMVGDAIGFCKTVKGKVVLSRVKEMPVAYVPWRQWLMAFRKAFPNAFVYLIHTERYGTWMGATPETLVRGEAGRFHTHALAGTRWDGQAFTQKEFEEQEVVTKTILANIGSTETQVSERKEMQYGALRHLVTEISWPSVDSITGQAERLHPTPAVCGVPAAEALHYILGHEPHHRVLYTGYLGWVDPNEKSHLFVNLRCMQLFRDRVCIFAGGGINVFSDPLAEWEETERKMKTLMDVMNLNG